MLLFGSVRRSSMFRASVGLLMLFVYPCRGAHALQTQEWRTLRATAQHQVNPRDVAVCCGGLPAVTNEVHGVHCAAASRRTGELFNDELMRFAGWRSGKPLLQVTFSSRTGPLVTRSLLNEEDVVRL